MDINPHALKKKYILFIASVALVIISMQIINQYDLTKQNSDARLINISGRQRLLSQRISKMVLYIHQNIQGGSTGVDANSLNILKSLSNEFERTHQKLLEQSRASKSFSIYVCLKSTDPYLHTIVKNARNIIKNPTRQVIELALMKISKAEVPFLFAMEKTVDAYQHEAERKLDRVKTVEFMLSVFVIMILVLEFIYIFHPSLNKLSANNRKLVDLNNQLTEANNDLVASDEEIRNNLEQINALQIDLEVRERQYRELVEDATDIIYELNHEGKFVFVNSVMEHLSGLEKEEIIGIPYTQLVLAEDRERVVQFYYHQRKNNQEVSYLEFRMLRKDGQHIWIGQNARMFFEKKWVYKISVVARDITLIKETRDKLAEREQLYRLLSENSTDIITLTDSNRIFKFVSQSCRDVLGYEPDELMGKRTLNFIHPKDIARLLKIGNEMRLTDKSIPTVEFRILHKAGYYIWVEAHVKPFHDQQKEPLVQSSFRDITKRKEAEEKLAESEKLYRLLSENSRDVISLHKLDGTFEYISPSCIDLHGYTPEEMIGKLGTEFMHPDDVKAIEVNIHRTHEMMEKGLSLEPMQFRIMSKRQGAIWAENMIKPIFTNGKLSGFQSTVRDISARKLYEFDLHNAKEKAEYATKSKSQFLGMMSHEIRTPMNAIIGLTNLLLRKETEKEKRDKLKLLKFSGENLLTIINDILDFSKIEANKMQIESIDLDMHQLIDKTIKMMESKSSEKGIKLLYEYDNELPSYFKGDPVRIGQVITNLLSNAVKFTERGEVTLTAKKISQQPHDVTLQIEVIDTGIGIPPEKLDSIFENFSQAESDTTRKFGGTGLGLAITQKFVHLMGGKIEVKSMYGQGSRFSIELTLGIGEKPDEVESEIGDLTSVLSDREISALLVDDNELNLLVATEFLQQWGIQVTVANNGKEAIEIIKQKSFDIILMDLQMPEMNGYEATKFIRSMRGDYFQNIPIVALTASAMSDTRNKVLAAGMSDFLSKPFQPHDLERIISKHISLYNKPTTVKVLETRTSLSNNFDQITKGNKEFKYKLLISAQNNLKELKRAFEHTLHNNDDEVFKAVVHKCKMTFIYLKNEALTSVLREIEEAFSELNQTPISDQLRRQFASILDQVIDGIGAEIEVAQLR